MLDQPGQFDRSITERLRVKADAAPPDKSDYSFYQERGHAALQLGRMSQALQDLRAANRLAEKAGIHDPRILLQLASVERDIGNFNRAVELLEESLELESIQSTYERLTATYIQMGDLEKARKTADKGKRFCADSPRRRNARFAKLCDIAASGMEGNILDAQAKYTEAESYYRRHLALAQTMKDEFPVWSINFRIQLAINLMKQERFLEAEVEAREALKESLGHAGKDSLVTNRVVSRLANILRSEGRLPEAGKLATMTIRSLEAAGISDNSNIMGQARMLLGSILAAQGEFTQAMVQFDIAMKEMNTDQYLYQKNFRGNPDFILSLLMVGRHREALNILNNSYGRAVQRFGERNYITVERLAFRGMANYRMKNHREAVKDFSAATDVLMEIKSEKADKSRIQRLKIIFDDYINLLGDIRGTPVEMEMGVDASGMAFRIAEAARSNTVQAALAANNARLAETNPELNDLIRREQDALKQIEVLEATLLDLIAAPSNEQKPEIIKDMQAKIISLNSACAAIGEEIKKNFPKYADFVNPQIKSREVAKQNLHPGEVLISIYSSDHKTYVWTIPYQGKMSFTVSPIGKKEIGPIVSILRNSLDPNPGNIGDIPEFDTNQAYELYRNLLQPVESAWKDATDLLVVSCSPLDQIPLSALATSPVKIEADRNMLFNKYRLVPWLIRKVSITMLPSVSSLIALRNLAPGNPARKAFAGFGDPIFSREQLAPSPEKMDGKETSSLASRGAASIRVRGIRITDKGGLDGNNIPTAQISGLNRLPDTAEEIRSVAREVGADLDRDVFLGKDASEHHVKTMNLSDRKTVSFATHAMVPGDLDGLDQPALALSSPSVTGDNDDGLLTMGEIMKLKLNADLVVLSACNTAAAEGNGAEALSGLGRAFFYAGTRSILASMYPVETTAAQKLIISIFKYRREDKKISLAKALQKSMLGLIDGPGMIDKESGKIVASYAHPLFWAPFVIVGDPGEHL
jgi:CHAT domain-containing protein